MSDEPGYGIGSAILAILILPQMYAVLRPDAVIALQTGLGLVFNGFYIIVIGCIFLAGYYYSHKCFLFRWANWLCEHWSFPESRKMAFFYFALALILGSLSILDGLGLFRA
jgi:hypothetical protein